MTENNADFMAEVVAIYPDKVKISVDDIEKFKLTDENLRVGSYLKISDNENVSLIAIIENFSIELKEDKDGNTKRVYIIEAHPLGTISGGEFQRGGDELAIPPKKVVPACKDDIRKIYSSSIKDKDKFIFCQLSRNRDIQIPVDGNKFFNKHIAIVGATGSGKSHTVARIIQNAVSAKVKNYKGLNNSHIVIFDLHSEYISAFPISNKLNVDNIILPYWLLNEEEMDELFLESGDFNNYNQASLLRTVITLNKQKENPNIEKIYFDSPVKYDINKIINCFNNLSTETKDSENSLHIIDDGNDVNFQTEEDKLWYYSQKKVKFAQTQRASKDKIGINRGPFADGSIDKFVRRIQAKVNKPRLKFMFGTDTQTISFEDVLSQLLGYFKKDSNVTLIDLSGIPFEVLSITVSLITRILFDYSYFYKRKINKCDTPLLLVFEEAHKYAPKSQLAKYRSSLIAIERVAKEGRKYGVSLLIASQRPSEISETIFSQCSNFIAMRLTNPEDQSYVRRLLPDTLGNLTSTVPALESGEALLIGDSVIMPALVYITPCDPEPSSNDIPYYDIWKEEWKKILFSKITDEWKK